MLSNNSYMDITALIIAVTMGERTNISFSHLCPYNMSLFKHLLFCHLTLPLNDQTCSASHSSLATIAHNVGSNIYMICLELHYAVNH